MSLSTEDKLRGELREFLEDLVVYGDGKGWVEYTDAGVWITDKGIDQAISIVNRERVKALEKLQKFALDNDYDPVIVNGYIIGAIKTLKSLEEKK